MKVKQLAFLLGWVNLFCQELGKLRNSSLKSGPGQGDLEWPEQVQQGLWSCSLDFPPLLVGTPAAQAGLTATLLMPLEKMGVARVRGLVLSCSLLPIS